MATAAVAVYLTATASALLTLSRNVIFAIVIVVSVSVLHREGFRGLIRKLVGVARLVPGIDEALAWALKRQVRGFLRQTDPEAFAPKGGKRSTLAIPNKGESSCMHAFRYGWS